MKIQARQIEEFIRRPNPKSLVILVYGPDDGLMRERAKALGHTVLEDLNDPFLSVSLTREEITANHALFFDEAHAIPMMPGPNGETRRLIRIKEASDSLTGTLKEYLEKPNPEALVILEGSDLGPRSSLRKLCEGHDSAVAVPCYADDDRSLRTVIQDTIREAGYGIEREALDWLASAIGGDRLKTRQELDKLITYMGPLPTGQNQNNMSQNITLEDVREICGEAGAANADELVIAAGHGNGGRCVEILDKLLQEGVPVIWVLRALQNHFRRLHEAKSKAAAGMNVAQALDSLRPPVFFKQKPDFQKQLSGWSLKGIEFMLTRLCELEAQAKSGQVQDQSLLAQSLLRLRIF